jgi:ADP-ribose pyrophosphatase
MEMTEKTLSSEYKYNGRIINTRVDTVLLPDGRQSKREIIEHSGGVGVIAVTEEGKIALVRQYRHPYGEIIYEIPAGKLEKGEQPLECGKRELEEETGFTADNWQSLGQIYPSPGYCAEVIHIFLATGLHKGESAPDDGEFLESDTVSLETAVQMVLENRISDAKTQIAVLKAALILNKR